MSRVIQDATACGEALARLPELNLGELRQQWRTLYKAEASPHLSRELLVRAVAYRMQEVALGGLRLGAAAPAPPNCTAVQANRSGGHASSPRTEARNPAGTGMARPNL